MVAGRWEKRSEAGSTLWLELQDLQVGWKGVISESRGKDDTKDFGLNN